MHKNKVRIRAIGHREMLPDKVVKAIEYAEAKTKDYKNFNYNLAVAYGGRQELVRSMEKIAMKVKQGTLDPKDIDADLVSWGRGEDYGTMTFKCKSIDYGFIPLFQLTSKFLYKNDH